MHHIRPPANPVTLIAVSGEKLSYASLEEALICLSLAWLRSHVGPHFVESRQHWQPGAAPLVTYHHWEYILRDANGRTITRADIEACHEARRRTYWLARYGSGYSGVGPVPGTGRRPNHRYYRALQATQERRWSIPVREADEPAPRGARKFDNIPNSRYADRCLWDSRENHNWKRYRKTRWKA